jgi:hypothetical protein
MFILPVQGGGGCVTSSTEPVIPGLSTICHLPIYHPTFLRYQNLTLNLNIVDFSFIIVIVSLYIYIC